jgi:hypothetical protein
MLRFTALLLSVLSLATIFPSALRAQTNNDWDVLWMVPHPASTNGPYGWMAGQRQYTGLAYDKWRDVLYIVNPSLCAVGVVTSYCPKIHVWDARTGVSSATTGRGATGVIGVSPGQAGMLPVPLDTIVTGPGWPGNNYGSFLQGQFPIYKIDVDDEGRIFAGNLVSPLFGICFPGPPPNCDPIYYSQGPFRLYRWDHPFASPKRVYATLNATQTSVSIFASPTATTEMTWTRWGDALDVVGKRVPGSTPGSMVDSVHILVSGGAFSGQSTTNSEVAFLTCIDTVTTKISNGLGRWLDYRQGYRLPTSSPGIAAMGIAATGPSFLDGVWVDSPMNAAHLFENLAGLPTAHAIGGGITDSSGAIAYCEIPSLSRKFLICAEGLPSGSGNYVNTWARVINVSTKGSEFVEPGLGFTPPVGTRSLTPNSGFGNYITDVDYKLEPDTLGSGYHLTLFVLMSNNGIAAYRTKRALLPVQLTTFQGAQRDDRIELRWEVTAEINNAGFEIQRGYDGARFETIGFVHGRGTATAPRRYSYDDPVNETARTVGTVSYRLRQVDTDGRSEYSPVILVLVADGPEEMVLWQNYPNPFGAAAGTHTTTIRYRLSQAGYATLRVFNAVGDEVASLARGNHGAGEYTAIFDASALPSGTYAYQLSVNGSLVQRNMTLMK